MLEMPMAQAQVKRTVGVYRRRSALSGTPSYSRHAEAAADAYSVELMQRADADANALGAILSRIASAKEEGFELLRDHPDTKARIAAINKTTVEYQPKPLLTAAEWKALKAICAVPADDGRNSLKPSTEGKPQRQSEP